MNARDKTKEELGNELQELQRKYNALEGLYNKDMTERVLAEQALIENEEKYRLIAENTSDGIIIMGKDNSIQYVSPAYLKQLDYTENEEMLFRTPEQIYSIIHPEDRDDIFAEIYKAIELKYSILTYTFRVKHKRGHFIWREDNAKFNYDSSGNYDGCYVICRDISKRREAEEKLRESEQLYRFLIVNLNEGILLEDSNRNIVATNQLFCDMFAIPAPAEALVGANCSDSAEQSKILFKNPEIFVADINQILTDKKTVHDSVLELADGRYFERDYIPTFIGNKYNGHLWKYRDITGRKKSEMALRESRERNIALLNANPDLMFVLDKKGTFIDYYAGNDGSLYTSADYFIGKNISEVLSADIAELTYFQLGRVFQTGQMQIYNYQLDINHIPRDFESRLVMCGDSKALSIVRDITESKNAIENLRHIKEFEAILLEISGQLINDSGDNLDAIFNLLLSKIGSYSNCDRAYIFSVNHSKQTISNTHEWCGDGIGCEIKNLQNVPISFLPLSIDILNRNQNIYLPDFNILSPLSELEKEYLEHKSLKSIIVTPFAISNKLTGFIGFDSVKQNRYWSDEEQELLKSMANIIANAIERKRVQTELIQQLNFSNALHRISEVIISSTEVIPLLEKTVNILGEALQTDRLLIYDVNIAKGFINAFCEWLNPLTKDVTSTKGSYPVDLFGVPLRWMADNMMYIVSHSDNISPLLSADNSAKTLHVSMNIKSGLWFPFSPYTTGYYLIVLNQTAHFRDWTDSETGFLESVSHQISIALNKIWLMDEKKKQEEHIRKLSLVVEQSPVSILITDTMGIIEYVNPKFSEVSGYSPEEVIGKNPNLWQSGVQTKEFYEELWNTILAGQNWYGEFQNKKKNGDIYWESAVISAVTDNNGDISFFIAIKEDITDDRKMLDDLIKAKERAEESDNLKKAFLNNISHEIRTPFNGILGFLSLFLSNELPQDERAEYCSIINHSAFRLMNTINDIVEISQIQAGQVKPILTDTNIIGLTTELCQHYKADAEAKGLKYRVKNSLPDNIEYINTDSDKLNVVLSKLIDNAIKFTKEGSIEIEICRDNACIVSNGIVSSGIVSAMDSILFSVKDTGVGIPNEKHQVIFKPFMQADVSSTRRFEGPGLGLAIAKSYVEMLGGEIWVKSDPDAKLVGKGSVFYFTIPYNLVPIEKTVENNTFSSKNAYNHINLEDLNLKVLIVEDDERSAKLLSFIVKPYCKEILRARTGIEAIEICLNNADLDLILMDIKMPDMDGYEATRIIRKYNTDVVIIAQTANALTEDREKSITAGCNDYISKPIDIALLKGLMAKYF